MTNAPASAEPTCSCGHTRAADEAIPEVRYSFMGMLTLIFGITARPTSIDFTCSRCKELIVRARDEATIRKFTK